MKALVATLLLVGALSAQEIRTGMVTRNELATPVLSDVQKLQLQSLSQQVELAQLRFTNLVLTLQVPGYTLDLASLTYVAKPEKD